ncbi:MAG: hypothetical protein HEQ19_09965 [Gloeotrichia echinulata CP02]|jgi:hypothetical protein
MEPVTATATAIVGFVLTGVSTGALGKVGEILIEQAGKLKTWLTEISPKAAAAFLRLEEEPLDAGEAYIEQVVLEELAAAGEKKSEFAQAIVELAKEAKADPNPKLTKIIEAIENTLKSQPQGPTVQNVGQLAKKINTVIQSPNFNIASGGIGIQIN